MTKIGYVESLLEDDNLIPHRIAEDFMYASCDDFGFNLYVVYEYYDKDWNLLYIGRSKNYFYAHDSNYKRLDFFNDVKYIGFSFFDTEEQIIWIKKMLKNNPDLLERFVSDVYVYRSEIEMLWWREGIYPYENSFQDEHGEEVMEIFNEWKRIADEKEMQNELNYQKRLAEQRSNEGEIK